MTPPAQSSGGQSSPGQALPGASTTGASSSGTSTTGTSTPGTPTTGTSSTGTSSTGTSSTGTEAVIRNACILDGDRETFTAETADTWIAFGGGVVTARGRGDGWKDVAASATVEVIDGDGGYVAPAFVDIHCHGAGGASAEDGAEEIETILAVHRAHGTRALALSYVSDTIDGLCRSLRVGAQLVRNLEGVIGLHAEGPFLSPDFKGAHAPEVLTAPTRAAVEAILDAADGTLAQITIAPELPGALDAIARFTSTGVRVAIGHTAADYELTATAFDAGASILTHAFNAMPGIHHRAPGPVIAAAENDQVTVELINDGVHVAAPVTRMLHELVPGRIALITDAMAATGMNDGQYMLGSLPVTVEDSVARLTASDGSVGSIAGSTLTMDAAVRRAVTEVGLSPIDAVQAAGLVPLRALGQAPGGQSEARRPGSAGFTGSVEASVETGSGGSGDEASQLLAVGMPADLLLLEGDMSIRESRIGA
ncbi:N-acetylglucosamine-6-phosphate deacetylase [Brevibacterium spongiae]|uniref:Amidohydrolase family protein n=1 Tax=Brevibacterium spongiae TaxID=2909672 RepID=A0ABY5SRS8_9MICO|nr:amidohydrolase family protein [Brevibacterium spongiae]UVI35883.1 amidohydrolase family protein [Brevibacterium spongiae]